MFSKFSGKKQPPAQPQKPKIADAYLRIRNQMIHNNPLKLDGPSDEHPNVFGVLMEVGTTGGHNVTFVSLIDGTTSMYTSVGGGMLGGGEHPQIAEASRAFVGTAENFLTHLTPTSDTSILPAEGHVRFYILTYSGFLTGEAERNQLGYNQHPLSPLFHSGDAVVTQIRLQSNNWAIKRDEP
jgi:hypothetical protein